MVIFKYHDVYDGIFGIIDQFISLETNINVFYLQNFEQRSMVLSQNCVKSNIV